MKELQKLQDDRTTPRCQTWLKTSSCISHQCKNNATVEREKVGYCKFHDPARLEAVREERSKEIDRKLAYRAKQEQDRHNEGQRVVDFLTEKNAPEELIQSVRSRFYL